jgi:hypothetical protein
MRHWYVYLVTAPFVYRHAARLVREADPVSAG